MPIQKGAHYCDQNAVKSITISEMKFLVKFDSSAIYQTEFSENQYAVNKLGGFSEGTDSHYNSAPYRLLIDQLCLAFIWLALIFFS